MGQAAPVSLQDARHRQQRALVDVTAPWDTEAVFIPGMSVATAPRDARPVLVTLVLALGVAIGYGLARFRDRGWQ